ncbi:MAG: DUF6675 family protein [Stellaceae bacterium]
MRSLLRPRLRAWRIAGTILFATLTPAAALAATGPVPPCAGNPAPAYPAAGAPPVVAVWRGGAFQHVRMPRCAGLRLAGATVAVALASRLEVPTLQAILARLGEISAMTGIRYWSITDGKYERLFEHAAAVTGPDGKHRRPNFTAAEIERGTSLYFAETDNRSGSDVVYRLRFRRIGPTNVVISIDNVSSVNWFGIPLLGPGDIRMVYFLQRAGRDWGFYALSLAGADFPLFSLFIRSQSYVNRAMALYRFLSHG